MASVWFSVVPVSDGRAKSDLAVPVHLPHLVPADEHVALLNHGRFDLLGRQDDFLDEGVAAIFGVAGGEAELLGLCFHARKFTSVEAKTWLSERGFAPLVSFRSQAGIAAQDFDATLECLKLKTSDPKPVAHR